MLYSLRNKEFEKKNGDEDMKKLQFKGQWRDYQKRILDRSEVYMVDGRVHISAAPGSGKKL